MITTAIIAFREFLEAFLLVGIFIGLDKKLHLGKRKEIILAAICGVCISISLPVLVFFFGQDLKNLLNEKTTDVLEGYLLTFSGFFLVYVVFTIHGFIHMQRQKTLSLAKEKMEKEIFDVSLFLTIVFFVAREGFEIALLIATTSIFSVFQANVTGLLIGFSFASIVGLFTSLGYTKLQIKKIFTFTEYGIIIIGAAMVKNGITLLFENYFSIHLNTFIQLPLHFLPDEETILGHALNNLVGIEQHLSLVQIVIMISYVFLVQTLFRHKKYNG